MHKSNNGNDDDYDMTEAYALQLSGVIGEYIRRSAYSVSLREKDILVEVSGQKVSFDPTLLDQANLSELELALNEAKEGGYDVEAELLDQLRYLEKS